MSNASHRIAPAILVALALTACSDSNRAFQANVTAASGGVFSDDAARPSITVRIPAGALAADADEVKNAPAPGANQVAASTAWGVALSAANGGPAPAISQAIQIELPANPAPAHPQLGEIARLSGSTWQRLQATFYRPSTQVVAALTTEVSGTYRATLRSLRRESGAAVDRGFQVFMYETFGNEAFFSGGLGLAALRSRVPALASPWCSEHPGRRPADLVGDFDARPADLRALPLRIPRPPRRTHPEGARVRRRLQRDGRLPQHGRGGWVRPGRGVTGARFSLRVQFVLGSPAVVCAARARVRNTSGGDAESRQEDVLK
jgi:hypothetical protein